MLPRIIALVFIGLVGQIPAVAQNAPFECRLAQDPIRIDGRATEAAWKGGQTIGPFHLQAPSREATTLTKAKLLWDDTALYFFAEMEDTDLYANIKERDGELWENDVIELFLKPENSGEGYYEFLVSPLGTLFDIFYPKRTLYGHDRFKNARKFAFAAKVTVEGTLNNHEDADTGWTVEGRIPWSDFESTGGKPKIGDTWRFALCRYDYSLPLEGGLEISVASPELPRDFHRHEDYVPLKFTGPWDPRSELPQRLQMVRGYAGSKVKGRPDPPLPYVEEQVLAELQINQMITFKFEPGSNQLLYVDQVPKVKGSRLMRYDLDGGEPQELLALDELISNLAFHPDYAQNGYFYLGYAGPQSADRFERRAQVMRYTMGDDGAIVPDSAHLIIEWPSRGHNGLGLAFGAGGMLFVTSGDGTSDSDTNLTGQDLSTIHAKVLRIDVENPDPGRGYSVPPDNPFVGQDGVVPETFAYGMRNPWRAHWDERLGRLWVGNNGQDRLEQAFLIERGANYGWSVYEGSRVFYAERKLGPTPVSLPTVEHDHGESRSLTGGVVYTGSKFPELKDAYVYGDNTTGKIWAVFHDGKKVVWNREIADTYLRVTDFGVDPKTGDLLVSDYRSGGEGGLFRLIPNPRRGEKSAFPRKLSQTGLFRSVADHEAAPELLPYGVNVPEWADGAEIQRFLMLPADDPHVNFSPRRGWNLPDGTVALQTFTFGGRRVETRMLYRELGEWTGYSYQWNEAQDDAELVGAKGADLTVNGQKWRVPSRSECMVCHSRAANFVVGLQSAQLNRVHDYGGGFSANQLEVMDHLGFFLRKGAPKPVSTLRQPPEEYDALAHPMDRTADLDHRARSFLHAACSHCHVEAGGGNAQMDLRYYVAREKMGAIGEPPYHGDLGYGADAKIIVPGHPEKSVMLNRCSRIGPGKMPPMGSQGPDPRAVGLLAEWILSLEDESDAADQPAGK